MTVLILGGTGFIGQHLAVHCEQMNEAVVVTGRSRPKRPRFAFEALDILDFEAIRRTLKSHKPKSVYHLAGFSSNQASQDQASLCYQTNIQGTQNVLQAMQAETPAARLLLVGSSAEYGAVTAADLPLRESSPLRPISPYGVSRVATTFMGQQQRYQKRGIETVIVRLFNIFGPGQKPTLICSEFAQRFAAAKKKGQSSVTLKTGDLSLSRDFCSIHQAVLGLRQALEKGRAFEIYNLCSGQARELLSIVQHLEQLSGLSAEIEQSVEKFRPGDPKCLVGCAEKLFSATGFRVREDFRACLGEMLGSRHILSE